MPQQVYLNKSFVVALVALFNLVMPAVIVVGLLYYFAFAFDVRFTQYFVALSIFAAALSIAMLRVRPPVSQVAPLMHVAGVAGELVLRWLAVIAILLATAYVTKFSEEFSRRVIVSWALVAPFMLVAGNLLCNLLLRRIMLSHDIVRSAVVVGFNQPGKTLAQKLTQYPELCLRLKGFFDDRSPERLGNTADLPCLGKLADVADFVRRNQVDVIFIALPMGHVPRVMHMVESLRDTTVSVYYVPDLFAFDLIQSRTGDIMGVPVVSMCETPFFGYRGVLKRVSDVILTLGVLVPTLPVMAVIALAIKLTSSGPVIFRQRRYGLDGREIEVYKFRSMYVTENGPQIVQATRDDPRITPIGRILRKYSLDELPQLFNVLQGRMSLVGPRPHAVAHNEEYRSQIKGYMIRHKALPGITGLAQVNGCRGETRDLADMEARVGYDLEYLKNWTPVMDLKILLMTVVRVFNDRHAY